MPYIIPQRREALDPIIADIVKSATNAQKLDLVIFYKKIFTQLARDIHSLLTSNVVVEGPSRLAIAIVKNTDGDKGNAYGNLHYAVARLLEDVPRELGIKYNYTLHAMIIGSVFKTAVQTATKLPDDMISNSLAGVFIDAVMEYKRKKNVAYEDVKEIENGEVYDSMLTPHYAYLYEKVQALDDRVQKCHAKIPKKTKKKVKKSAKVAEDEGKKEV